MRLLLLSPHYAPVIGGAELQAQRLARALTEAGLFVTVLTLACPGQEPESTERGVRVLRRLTGVPYGPLWGLTFMHSTSLWLHKLADDWDVVHNQQVGLHSWASVRAAASLRKASLLRFACSGPGGDLVSLSERRFGLTLIRGLRNAGRFISLTAGGAAEIEQFGLPADRIRTIPNGVDLSELGCLDWPDLSATDPMRLLFVGRLVHQKGIDVLIDAFAMLEEPQKFRLRVVGAGSELASARRRVSDAGLDPFVEFVSAQQDITAQYEWSEVVVLPSRYEGMPNVVLEAMASARPVLGTNIDGTAQLVTVGQNGWLVPKERPTALAAAIRDIGQQRQRLRLMGHNGRRTVEERYSLRRTCAMYVTEYEALLARRALT
jgi:glycosyltransferase involved in cell wall biosynthesis